MCYVKSMQGECSSSCYESVGSAPGLQQDVFSPVACFFKVGGVEWWPHTQVVLYNLHI